MTRTKSRLNRKSKKHYKYIVKPKCSKKLVKRTKNTQRTKKTPQICSPHVKSNNKSCFSKEGLIKLIEAWNRNNQDKIIYNMHYPHSKLWELLNQKMKQKKCSQETCWVNQDFVKNIKDDEELDVFRPLMPVKWEQNPREWLNTLDIQAVMEQYEKKYDDFNFIGPVPIDFDDKLSFGQCVSNELCNINIPELNNNGIRKIGVIFNLDKHNESGSHWIAMFCNLNKGEICYWDSYGMKPPSEVSTLMKRLKKQSSDIGKQMKIKINKHRHQYKNTECGIYCLHFITRLLEGESFENITKNKIDDDAMFQNRDFFFVKN